MAMLNNQRVTSGILIHTLLLRICMNHVHNDVENHKKLLQALTRTWMHNEDSGINTCPLVIPRTYKSDENSHEPIHESVWHPRHFAWVIILSKLPGRSA